MTRQELRRAALALLGILVITMMAGIVEPCDGHSCQQQREER